MTPVPGVCADTANGAAPQHAWIDSFPPLQDRGWRTPSRSEPYRPDCNRRERNAMNP